MNYEKFSQLIDQASKVVVVQADNPDGDSLASSLTLEEILSELGKEVILYCNINIPRHLRHLEGWDRVTNNFPNDYDAMIVVDTASSTLLDTLLIPERISIIKKKPLIIIDHHDLDSDIEYSDLDIVDRDAVATGEVLYNLAKSLDYKLTDLAKNFIAVSIMSDSLGLNAEGTTAKSIRVIADLVEDGVSLAQIDAKRRLAMKKSLSLTKYKGELLKRIELLADDNLALVHIPFEDIQNYSDQYNPSMLVIEDMRLIEGVKLAVAIKTYPDGKITGKIRANHGHPIADKVASRLGGGGHEFAAGFKTHDLSYEEVRTKLQQYVNEAVDEAV